MEIESKIIEESNITLDINRIEIMKNIDYQLIESNQINNQIDLKFLRFPSIY